MAKSICLFNHKGGVSKTTTAFNLGWSLAAKGFRVMMVDLDAQCNLTGLVLGYESLSDGDGLPDFYANRHNLHMGSVVDALIQGTSPEAFMGIQQGRLHQTLCDNLLLFPGHLSVAELDAQISVSLKIASGVPATKNIPANLPKLIGLVAEAYDVDYVLYDLSPNVGGLNEVILMSSDYFIVPTSPDFYCWQAIGSLATHIPKWHREITRFKEDNGFGASYPIRNRPKFLGAIQQRYRPRKGAAAKSFELWITRIRDEVNRTLVPALERIDCTVPREELERVLRASGLKAYDLANIADFNSLIAMSQKLSVPIFALTDEQIKDEGQFGHALQTMSESKEAFAEEFEKLADRVIALTARV